VNTASAQDLEEILNQKISQKSTTDYVTGTFKGTRLVTGHSTEIAGKNDLLFIVAHRFGQVNSGFYSFFGLDDATMRIGFEYGLINNLSAGIGRNTYEKTFDGFLKYKLLRQSTGDRNIPVTLTLFTSATLNTLKPADPEISFSATNRLSYVFQALISRKVTPDISLQVSPVLVHKNLVERRIDQNNIAAVGVGGRYRLTNRLSVSLEYYYLLPGQTADDYCDALSIGFDIETGGHIFQLLLTNSRPVFESEFITEASGSWLDGNIHFGFNITRVFHPGK
jgi:hypothetical protein